MTPNLGQAFSKTYVMTDFVFILLADFFLPVLLVFDFDHWVCKESMHRIHIQIIFTSRNFFFLVLLCQMCQCNKVVHTVEFQPFSVIWLFLGLNSLKEASSAVVHLNPETLHTVIDSSQYSVAGPVWLLERHLRLHFNCVCLRKWTGIELIFAPCIFNFLRYCLIVFASVKD